MEHKHILLLSDLSEESQRAFGAVANLARWTGAKVTLLHVIQILTKVPAGAMLSQPVVFGDPDKERHDAKEALKEQRALLGDEVEVDMQVVIGDAVATAVNEYAAANDIGLIALSTHGRSGLKRMVLGSVAEEILRRSHVPVLCFPPRE